LDSLALGHLILLRATPALTSPCALAETLTALELTGVYKGSKMRSVSCSVEVESADAPKSDHAKTDRPDKFATITEIARLFTALFAFVI
jgi:hypothetical protein